jgi:hypothetical protein
MAPRRGLNHIAMSVPVGTLSSEYRDEVLAFYGPLLGWHELEDLRLPDRLTLAVGHGSYVNLREREQPMACHGYEHFGVVLGSGDEVERLCDDLKANHPEVRLEPVETGPDGYRVVRFQHLLPLAVEVQYFPDSTGASR